MYATEVCKHQISFQNYINRWDVIDRPFGRFVNAGTRRQVSRYAIAHKSHVNVL